MSYDQRSGRRSTKVPIKSIIDMVMGVLYALAGSMAIIATKIGKMQIPEAVAYVLGGMIVLYGGMRFYRGYRVMVPPHDDNNTPDAP